jgi:hypothetical protein
MMLLFTTLSGTTQLIPNLTSLVQTVASATGLSGLPTLPTVLNGTESYIRDTSDNISSLTSETGVVSDQTMLSTDWNNTGYSFLNDTSDNLTNTDMEDISYGNLAFIDEQTSTPLSENFTQVNDRLFDSTVGRLDITSSTDDSSTASDVTVLNTESTAFEVSEDFDNTSDNFTDNSTCTESILQLNCVSVTNSTVVEDSKTYGLSSVTESEETKSVVVTTLETSPAQSEDSVITRQYTDDITPTIHETTADVSVSTECSSSECSTLSTDGTASSWEPPFAPDATSDTHSAAITAETTSMEESHGMCKIEPLVPSDPYMGRTAQLTPRSWILNTYSTNICTEYFKHAA